MIAAGLAPGGATLHVVRVFCAADGSGGNPLGVFLDGGEVPEAERQDVARDLGFAETVFVDEPARGVLRIYTPETELPLAGHPLVGSAWLLLEQGFDVPELRPPAGEIPVQFEGELTLRSPPTPNGVRPSSSSSSTRRPRSMRSPARRTAAAWRRSGRGSTRTPALIRMRVFVPEAGIDEDEATGSAALRLCAAVGREIEIRQGRGSVLLRAPRAPGLGRGGGPGGAGGGQALSGGGG